MRYCLICFNSILHKASITSYFSYKDVICEECRRKMQTLLTWKQVKTLSVFCIYHYDGYMESLLFQFKEGRDTALKDVFLKPWLSMIETEFKDYTLVFMPSSKEKQKERGFSPLLLMFENVHLPTCELFEKKKDYKQSAQNYENRKHIQRYLTLKKEVEIPKGKILLVDDVMTSGYTLLSAYALLKEHSDEVKGLVLCDHSSYVELCDGKKFPFVFLDYILKRKQGGVCSGR